MKREFTWIPDKGASVENEPKRRVAQFGDGYQQRVGSGINASPRSWRLEFTRPRAKASAIDAFLNDHAGVTSFIWMPPVGGVGKWICASWSATVPARGTQKITATFEEVFGD